MTPDRLRRLSDLLDVALDLPESQREAWLGGLPDEAATLVPTLREMLMRPSRETGDLLDRGPAFLPPNSAALAAGGAVGPYRLLSPLGAGGMAEVWLAERIDGTLRRKVALKLPHMLWAPGLPERFAREREILSTLEHPNIARLYDAGLEEAGRPYMALEFVEGCPIDAYCKAHALSVDARLRLLLQVADAVAFAHSRLVVHRDLKPGNILVTEDGQVRLLDFGIAKMLHGELAVAETALTKAAGRALTFDYASPEQIRGEPVGTASDVYSLAVVAFELLAGARPYRLTRGSAEALEHAIAQADAPLASSVAEDPALRKRLRGDLDAILNQALRKEVSRRYATVDALAQDWRRHLSGQRVLARPDTLVYRLQRAAWRHRVPLAAAAIAIAAFGLGIGAGATALVILALLIGLAVSAWQARRARAQARIAQVEARTAKAVQNFIEGIFRSNSANQMDPLAARQRTAKDLLDAGAVRIERELDEVPHAKLRVLSTLAEMYGQMGEFELKLKLNERWVATAVRALEPDSSDELEARADHAYSLVNLERLDDAEAVLERAARVLAARPDHSAAARLAYHVADAWFGMRRDNARGIAATERALPLLRARAVSLELIDMLAARATLLTDAGRPAEALEAAREGLALFDSRTGFGRGMQSSLQVLAAEAEAALGRPDAAATSHRDSIASADRNHGPSSPHAVIARVWFGQFLLSTSELRQAAEVLTESLAIVDTWPDSSNKTTFAQKVVTELLGAHVRLGRLADAEALALRGAELGAERMQNHSFAVRFLINRAALALELGEFEEARQDLDAAGESIGRDGLAEHPVNIKSYGPTRVRLHADLGEGALAIEALRAWQASSGRPTTLADDDFIGVHTAALAHFAHGDVNPSIALCERGLASLQRHPQRAGSSELEANLLALLGQACLARGDTATAVEVLQRAEALQGQLFDPECSPTLARVQLACGSALLALGDRAAALERLRRAQRIRRRHARMGPQCLTPLCALERAFADPRSASSS